jgi:uncharacterized protein YneF (UPF0154 family)
MTQTLVISIVLLAIIGVLGGGYIARKSHQKEKVQGGTIGRATHFLASAILVVTAPAVLCSATFLHPEFLGEVVIAGFNLTPLADALVIALILVVAALVLLIIHAIFARPEIDRADPVEDRGWTAEDARKSGL